MPTKSLFFIATVLSLVLYGTAQSEDGPTPAETPAAQQEDQQSDNVWMRMKMKYAQNIYSSIAQADVEAISVDAKRMKALNWFEGVAHGKDAAYQEQMQVFRLANDKLIAEADKRNLDGCTLAFMQMTFSCTGCHKRLRDATPPNPPR